MSPEPLALILRCMEARLSIVFGREVIFNGSKETLDALIETNILTPSSDAWDVTCPECQQSHEVHLPSGNKLVRGFYECPNVGRIWIPIESLRSWLPNIPGLADFLCRGLHTRSAASEIISARLWHLGKLTLTDRSVEVYLARGAAWADAAQIFASVRLDDSLILTLSSTSSNCFPQSATVVSLRAVVHQEGSRFTVDITEISRAIAMRSSSTLTSQNVFRKDGHKWVVCYDGSDLRYLNDLVGLTYIHRMLEQPFKPIRAVDLYQIVQASLKADSTLVASVEADAHIINGASSRLDDPEDNDAIYKATLKKLEAEAARAKRRSDHSKLASIQEQMDALHKFTKFTFGKRGRPRTVLDSEKKPRQAVSIAITRALSQVRPVNKALYEHLKTSISTGAECCYSPNVDVQWTT